MASVKAYRVTVETDTGDIEFDDTYTTEEDALRVGAELKAQIPEGWDVAMDVVTVDFPD